MLSLDPRDEAQVTAEEGGGKGAELSRKAKLFCNSVWSWLSGTVRSTHLFLTGPSL